MLSHILQNYEYLIGIKKTRYG